MPDRSGQAQNLFFRKAEAVEPDPVPERLFSRTLDLLCGNSHREIGNERVFLGHPQNPCHLIADAVSIRDVTFHVQDYSAAIQNLLLAITDLGYASCWIEGHITDTDRIGYQMQKILGVPDEYDLVCFLPVGIPAEEIRPVKKQPFEARAWLNGFEKPFV